ncbi:hypothetical protein [Methyloglobulus sp.]|uniref:hypothetical protein n=1 Tax=Methyloglobulus sp. TaxID=2518622 RepID=UPI0039892C51
MQLDIPTSWDNALLDGLIAQSGNGGESFQIYGALPAAFPTGRPDDVPKISRETAAGHFVHAKRLGIETNYLLNGIKGARCLTDDPARVGEYLRWITRELRPDLITVSEPELQRTLNRDFGWESFCISAIAGIRDRCGIEQWIKNTQGYGTVRSLVLHHDVTQCGWQDILEIAEAAKNFGIRAKLMMTESCYGGCQVRQTHYAHVGQAAGAQAFSDPYQASCMLKRLTDPASLLDLAGFITPEELHFEFGKTGMEGFKITGRSCSAAWIERACSHYLTGRSPKNLYDLIVFTAPLLREKLGMELEQLFFLDAEAYGEFIAHARDLSPDDRKAFTQVTAAQLFNLGLFKINDPGSIYEVHNGTLRPAVPGKYFSMLQENLLEGQGGEMAIKIAKVVVGKSIGMSDRGIPK